MGKKFKSVSKSSLEYLCNYHWPGNIRELQNILERAAIVGQPSNEVAPAFIASPSIATLADAERQHIINILNSVNWVIAGKQGAAEILDLPPSTLRSKIKKLNIER